MKRPKFIITEEMKAKRKEIQAAMAKRQREWYKSLSPERKLEMKHQREGDVFRRKRDKEIKREEKELKLNIKRELAILMFMKKHDILNHHHGTKESSLDKINEAIEKVKTQNKWEEYDSYIWNYQGEGNDRISICLMGNIFRSSEFKSIYDVPLDGTYKFHIYDTGQRGLGSFDHITATKVETPVQVPHVNPGAFFPITVH